MAKLTSDAVSVRSSADPTGSSETGIVRTATGWGKRPLYLHTDQTLGTGDPRKKQDLEGRTLQPRQSEEGEQLRVVCQQLGKKVLPFSMRV